MPQDLEEALNILTKDLLTFDQAEKLFALLKGQNSKIDKLLVTLNRFLSVIKNLGAGDIIELSAQNLPESTEKEKKRKKAIIIFIKTIKELKNEVERVKSELNQSPNNQSSQVTFIKIFAKAKGPIGVVTIAAIIIVIAAILLSDRTAKTSDQDSQISASASPKRTTQVISFQDKKIPLSELEVRRGADCSQEEHYHAKNGTSVTATDGTNIADPGACAYGKVKETKIEEI